MRGYTILHKGRGFTITEALVTVLVFSFFLAVLFVTMAYGFRTFSVAVSRSDVTTEARRLMLFMESELRGSAYFSVSITPRPVTIRPGVEANRDGLCFASMNDWSDPDAYNRLEARPNWDRYLLYYATSELPAGRLVRLALDPQDAAEIGSFPYPPYVAAPKFYLTNTPLALNGPDLANVKILASKVKSFHARRIPTSQEVEVRTILRQNGIMSRRGDKNREGGTFELKYRVHPQNTK